MTATDQVIFLSPNYQALIQGDGSLRFSISAREEIRPLVDEINQCRIAIIDLCKKIFGTSEFTYIRGKNGNFYIEQKNIQMNRDLSIAEIKNFFQSELIRDNNAIMENNMPILKVAVRAIAEKT